MTDHATETTIQPPPSAAPKSRNRVGKFDGPFTGEAAFRSAALKIAVNVHKGCGTPIDDVFADAEAALKWISGMVSAEWDPSDG